jgi:hypothetical protein
VGTIVVIEVLPLADFLVEELRGVDYHTSQEGVKLVFVDAVAALNLPI